jgi:DNA-binding MarR family transcriptional regulator
VEKKAGVLPESICNGTALRKATRRVSQLYDAVLAPCGLRSTQRSILIHIARAGTPTIGDLAAALVLDRSALAHNLKPLERDGFVLVVVDPADKRNRLVTLTAVGTAKLEESQRLWLQAQHRFEAAFGVGEASALRQSLAVIASAAFAKAFQDSEGAMGV